MKSLLVEGDLSLALQGKVKKSKSMIDEWKKFDKKVRATIILSLPSNVSTKKTWK